MEGGVDEVDLGSNRLWLYPLCALKSGSGDKLICPECGSYQPDRAKFCGICGSVLSQEGLVESFLGEKAEHDILIPRRRSILFYLVLTLIVVVSLAVLAGGGYLVYRLTWGSGGDEEREPEVLDNTLDYNDPELGYSISYPNTWTLENEALEDDELASLSISLTTMKSMTLRAYQIDPLVSIGGLESIEEFLVDDALNRMRALGGEPGNAGNATSEDMTSGGGTGYGTVPGGTPGTESPAGSGEVPTYDLFTASKVSGLPAFYTEFDANAMGEETRFLLFYIVAGDYLFVFQARAPYGEYKEVRPQFFSITGSFKWESEDGSVNPPQTGT